MSRSNPTAEKTPHPCQFWLEWKGGVGHLTYWDKNKGEDGERVAIEVAPKPFRCVPLAITRTVTGYSKIRNGGIYANEILDHNTDPLTVRCHADKEVIASGLWKDIKDVVTNKKNSGKFAINLYFGYKDGAALKVGCWRISGCALSPWFEFEKKNKRALMEKGLVIGKGEHDTSGSVEFYPPVFSLCDIAPETDVEAKKLDVELQSFFKEYFAKAAQPVVTPPSDIQEPPPREIDPADFQQESPIDKEDVPF